MLPSAEWARRGREWFAAQPVWKRVAVCVAAAAAAALGVAGIVFYQLMMDLLVRFSDKWAQLPMGRLLLFALIFLVAFPPLLGYSLLSMLCGMAYGFPGGWPILAGATVFGLFVLFLVFRHLLRARLEQMMRLNDVFRAFAEIFRENNSLLLLVLLRLCPLPYSLSNGALAAVPSLPAHQYLLAGLITCPKLMIHTFIGHSVKNLGTSERPRLAKIIDLVSILITSSAVTLATFVIYRRMREKLAQYDDTFRPADLVYGEFDLEASVELGAEVGPDDFEIDEPAK